MLKLMATSKVAHTLSRVDISKEVKLVQRRECHENKVPHQEDGSKLLVESPVVEMECTDQEDDSGKEAEGRVDHALALNSHKTTRVVHGGGDEPR